MMLLYFRVDFDSCSMATGISGPSAKLQQIEDFPETMLHLFGMLLVLSGAPA